MTKYAVVDLPSKQINDLRKAIKAGAMPKTLVFFENYAALLSDMIACEFGYGILKSVRRRMPEDSQEHIEQAVDYIIYSTVRDLFPHVGVQTSDYLDDMPEPKPRSYYLAGIKKAIREYFRSKGTADIAK